MVIIDYVATAESMGAGTSRATQTHTVISLALGKSDPLWDNLEVEQRVARNAQ
jgi:hypothetical protein